MDENKEIKKNRKELNFEQIDQINGGIMTNINKATVMPGKFKTLKEAEEYEAKASGHGRELHKYIKSSAFINMVEDLNSQDA